jgi:hypothetical protein
MTRRIDRVASAYVDDKMFSVELSGAVRYILVWRRGRVNLIDQYLWQVLSQESFVAKMHALGWTEPGNFHGTDNEIVLQHAIARYHAYVLL